MSDKVESLVSVIIPVYNRDKDVFSTLMNIFENNHRPIQLILVDDGSTDDSLKVLGEFKKRYETHNFGVSVLQQTNQGAPAARNLGYSQATGDFIQFLDSDDFLGAEKFQRQIAMMNNEHADFGLCDFEMIYTDTGKRVYHSNAEKIKKVIRTHGSFGCGSPLLRRQLADKIKWNTKLKRNQDVDYFQKAALLARAISYSPSAWYTYVRHENERISMTYDKTNPVYGLRIKSLLEIWRHAKNRPYLLLALWNLILSLSRFKVRNGLKQLGPN